MTSKENRKLDLAQTAKSCEKNLDDNCTERNIWEAPSHRTKPLLIEQRKILGKSVLGG
jgi:hypothetical protein